jgi:hypothetical protein
MTNGHWTTSRLPPELVKQAARRELSRRTRTTRRCIFEDAAKRFRQTRSARFAATISTAALVDTPFCEI